MDRKVISWRGMVIITVIFLAVFGVAMLGILSSRRALENDYALKQQQVVVMEQDVAKLRSELARVGTDGYVENEAREKYDYIKQGEMRFAFSDPQKLQYYTEEEWQIILQERLY